MKIVESFEQLRQHVHREGLMDARPWFYVRKVVEVLALMSLSVTFQCFGWYLCSALALAVCWQQSGWLTHEFCHHQPLKRRAWNDAVALLFGNVVQGFSRDWWKDKHNTHHAATNIIGLFLAILDVIEEAIRERERENCRKICVEQRYFLKKNVDNQN